MRVCACIEDVSGNAGEQQVIYMSASSWLHVLTLPNASCPTQPTGQVVVAAASAAARCVCCVCSYRCGIGFCIWAK